ncbi:MAG: Eco57I restriction-modification methylase domain-containing protein [Promethearchaeota archaeon]
MMFIAFESLVEILESNFKKINDNEYIVKVDEETGQKYILLIIKLEDLKNSKKIIKELKEQIVNNQDEAEKPIIQFGIIFDSKYVHFIKVGSISLKLKVDILRKRWDKISPAFLKKFKNLAKNFGDFSCWSELFNRSDIIDEFYKLFNKAKDNFLSNIRDISDDVKKEIIADNLLMQLLIVWYLQEKGFLNGDKNFLIKHFKDYSELGYNNFYDFIKELFKIMMGDSIQNAFNDETNLGKIVITGPAPFLNGSLEDLRIPDKVFYIDGETEFLKKTEPKNVSTVPILNLFESRDWTIGNIDEFVLGAIYEKMISRLERKKLGAFYTPEEITSYICRKTIEPFLLNKVNNKFNFNYGNLNEIFNNCNHSILYFLFEELKSIKILDPAVGSAHFLESAIEFLTEIYEKILNIANELNLKKGFEIIASDVNGTLKKIELLNIDDINQIRLYLKFFIILSKNIYGVDINQSALNIAKARLFLLIAKHFNFKKRYIIRFPNIHFNLRNGNSLIGYLNLKERKIKSEKFSLDIFLQEDKKLELTSSLNIVNELIQYLNEASEILNIQNNFNDKIEYLNKLLLKQSINWDEFKRLLNIKEELIRILIVSLNSKFAIPLNNLINKINSLFYKKLNVKFQSDYKLKKVKKYYLFHWIFEFPEVFLEKGGFDVIIGNPPYLSSKDILDSHKEIFKELYSTAKKQFDLFTIFMEQCFKLLHKNSLFGFIIPDSFLSRSSFEPIRELILQETKILFIDIIKVVFQAPTVSNAILIYEKARPKNNESLISKSTDFEEFVEDRKQIIKVSQDFFKNIGNHSILFIGKNIREILEKISKNCIKFNEIIEIHRGEELGKKSKKILNRSNARSKKFLFGEDVNRYNLSFSGHYINKDDIKKEKNNYFLPKILIRQLGRNLNAAFDENGGYITLQAIYNVWITDNKFHPKYILSILNSKLMDFYYTLLFKKELFPRILLENIEELPIARALNSQQKKIVQLVDNLINYINLKNIIMKFWGEQSLLGNNIKISLKQLIYMDEAQFQDYGLDEYWIDKLYFSLEENSTLANYEFESFRISSDDDLTIIIHGIDNSEEILLLKIRTLNKKYADIIYLDLISLLESKKKIKTIKDIYSKSEISLIPSEKWQKSQNIVNLIDKLELKLDIDKSIFSKKVSNVAFINKNIEELENLIDAYIFKLYELTPNQIKHLLNTLNSDERTKKDILLKFKNLD